MTGERYRWPLRPQHFILHPVKTGGFGTEYTVADTEEGGQPCTAGKGMPKTIAMIVIEGLKGRPVAELWTEHQISQAQ
jgi:hypothetical protein